MFHTLCTLWTVIYSKKVTFVPFILKKLPILTKNTSLARGTTGSEDFERLSLINLSHCENFLVDPSQSETMPFHRIITNNDQNICYRLSHDWLSKQYLFLWQKISSSIVALQRKCKEINGNKEDLRLLQSVREKCELRAKSEG